MDPNRGWGRGPRGGRGGRVGRGGRGGWRGGPPMRGSWRGNGNPRGRGNFNYGPRNQNFHRPNRDNMPTKRLSEEEIGVTEYVSDHKGFNGIIKSRYSDFQVSEINLAGEMAILTDTTIPKPPKDADVTEDEDLVLNKFNLEILPMETWDKINNMAVTKDSTDKVELDATDMTKEERTRIHDAVKKAFGGCIIGKTVPDGDKKVVSFERFKKGVYVDNRVKWRYNGEFVHFIVHKENCDTMEAASKIADRLSMNGIKPGIFGYAGTKDRRAKTTQWFSIKRIEPKRILNACRDMREIAVGNFTFSRDHLKLGMLKGNRFRIALRNVTAPAEAVRAACEQLRRGGFINYYGLQRFGTRIETPTYEVGIKLLKGNYLEAIESVLSPRPGPLCAALSEYARSHNAAAASALAYRVRLAPEARLLHALATTPRDYLGALDKIPRNTRLLYIHSYQSLIWNRTASVRARLGLTPRVGDLVLEQVGDEPLCVEDPLDDEASDAEEEPNSDLEKVDESPQEPMEQDPEQTENKEEKPAAETEVKVEKPAPKPRRKVPVRVLTEQDVQSGKYTIFDIILPLPGYNIEYPPNLKYYYEELLTKDGLTLGLNNKVKSYSTSGAYRHMVVRPSDVTYSLVRYTNPFGDLILSDVDIIENKEVCIVEDGKYQALLINMTLPASCYATMALRELMKVNTSGDTQAAQNNYHREDTTNDKAEKTVVIEDKSDDKQDKSDDKQDKPDDKQDKPDDKQDKPDDKQAKPDDKQDKPDDKQDKPDDKQDKTDGNADEKLQTGEKRKLDVEDADDGAKKAKQGE